MSTTELSPNKLDVYALVTNRIIDLLEEGTPPWQKPWAEAGLPINLVSKRPYRGINVWLLLSLNYPRNYFITWDQLKKIGGSVKQGEHGHIVIFWKSLLKNTEPQDGDVKPQKPAMLRYYKVFNIDQCKDIPDIHVPAPLEDLPGDETVGLCEQIVKQMQNCPRIKFQKQQAFYAIQEDYINMPKKKTFKSIESYYSILFHEMVHSTGHESRLNRKTVTAMAEFGSEPYSMEELVAEIGSSYLCNAAGIITSVINDSAVYIEGWLSQLRKDKRFIIVASSYAQKAADYILNVEVEHSKSEGEEPMPF